MKKYSDFRLTLLLSVSFLFLVFIFSNWSKVESFAGLGTLKKMATWTIFKQNMPSIVLEDDSNETCRFAATELQKYLFKIFGNKPQIVKKAKRLNICLSLVVDEELGDEGYEFAVSGNTFQISSGGPSGLVYGVYEFLRRFCGCRFSGLGPDGEFVPERDKTEIQETVERHTPKLWYRGLRFALREPTNIMIQRIDWMAKNGLNFVGINPVHKSAIETKFFVQGTDIKNVFSRPFGYTNDWFRHHILPEIQRRGLKIDMNHHNLYYWLPPAKYFGDHPDWYALKNGKRSSNVGSLSICTSNSYAVRMLINNMLSYLRNNPQTRIIGVNREDGAGFCECEECRKLDVSPDTKIMGRYALLVNEVARAVRVEFPDVLVGMVAYGGTLIYPPQKVELEENIVPRIAMYWRCSAHPLAQETCDRNSFFYNVLKKWRSVYKGNIILNEYYMGMDTYRSMPFPVAEVICREWPGLKELGIEGAAIQSRDSNQNIYGLNYLAFARCGWQNQVSYKKLLEDYLLGMFGSVADNIRPIYEKLQKRLLRIEKEGPEISPFLVYRKNGCFLPSPHGINYLIQTGEFDLFKAYINTALKKANPDREQRQVKDFAAAVNYWQMAANVFAMESSADRAVKEGHIDAAIALYEEVIYQAKPVIEYIERQPLRGWIAHIVCIDQFKRHTVRSALRRIEELKKKTKSRNDVY